VSQQPLAATAAVVVAQRPPVTDRPAPARIAGRDVTTGSEASQGPAATAAAGSPSGTVQSQVPSQRQAPGATDAAAPAAGAASTDASATTPAPPIPPATAQGRPAAEAAARASTAVAADQPTVNAPAASTAPTPTPVAVSPVASAAVPAAAAHSAAAPAPTGTGTAGSAVPQLDTIANAVRLASLGNGRSLTVSLSPRELGKVEISVSRQDSGPAAVTLAVERPETLALLRRDTPALQSALDQAGLSVAPHHLTMTLASNAPTAAPATTLPGGTADAGLGAGAGSFGGQGRSQPQRPDGQGAGGMAAPSSDAPLLASTQTLATARGSRGGIDITA